MLLCAIFENKSTGIFEIIYPASMVDKDGLIEIVENFLDKDVPFKVFSVGDIPTDRGDRDTWIFDLSNPDGYGKVTQ